VCDVCSAECVKGGESVPGGSTIRANIIVGGSTIEVAARLATKGEDICVHCAGDAMRKAAQELSPALAMKGSGITTHTEVDGCASDRC